ncbi:hypothetical protein ID866_4394 [Astraeus odoratus]|nr:hypothetical protein ID866_4394 [Astraeus odoratus]
MFLVEGCVISHPAPLPSRLVTHDSHEAFAIDLDDLQPEDSEEGVFRDRSSVTSDVVRAPPRSHDVRSAYPLSLGLVVHALVDGYALGVSATDEHSSTLSLIVFFAIIVHKAPTALALTISLLSRSLPLAECKRHLVVFSLATPASAILTYLLYSLPFVSQRLGAGVPLLFSGGTFLYVATALQNTSERDCSPAAGEISKVFRTILFVAGMFFPLLVSQSLGHGH